MIECAYLPVDSVGIEDIVPLKAKYVHTENYHVLGTNRFVLNWFTDDIFIINGTTYTLLCLRYDGDYFSAFDVSGIELSLLGRDITLTSAVTVRNQNSSIKDMVLGVVARTLDEKLIAKLTFG